MSEDRLEILLAHLKESPKDDFLLFAIAKEYEKNLKSNNSDYIGLYYHLGKLYEVISEDLLAVKTYKEGIDLAKKQGDFHALSELNNALTNVQIQMGN